MANGMGNGTGSGQMNFKGRVTKTPKGPSAVVGQPVPPAQKIPPAKPGPGRPKKGAPSVSKRFPY